MLWISLYCAKQTIMTEDRGKQQSAKADGIAGSAYDDMRFCWADVEQPKHLLVYDLGLGDSDQAFHSLSTHDHRFHAAHQKLSAFALRQPITGGEDKWQEKNQELYASIYSSSARNAIIETRAPGLSSTAAKG